jgi:PAS domain S-box-containing protein
LRRAPLLVVPAALMMLGVWVVLPPGLTVVAVVLLGQVLLGGLVLMARAQRQRQDAEQRLLEREESTRGILEAAADAFVAIDTAGLVTFWSGQSERLFGWTSEQACGSSLAELIVPAALRQRHTDAINRLAATGVPTILGQRIELSAVHCDGHEFPVELVIWQSEVGGKLSFNAFIHDISDRKQHEAQLAAARDEALEASRVKTEFLAVMSHELRTPMNGVLGMTSLLLGTALSAQQRDYAETVRTSADRLLGLLNDVLDLSKVEADRLELEVLDFDLNQLVRDVVQLLEVGAKQKGVALTAAIDDDVRLALRGDPARVRQVLLNLVGNAVKFTSTGSVQVRVLTDPAPHSDGVSAEQLYLRFEVTDTGIGVAPEARGRLFESFSQADASTTRRYGGTGLGLAISKSLVALFDGEIGVDSRLGVGSTFWFTARFSAGTPIVSSAPDPVAVVRPRAAPGLVLVVDDIAINQKVAVRMLESLGHRADVAADGAEAVEAWARVPYDLILMDCRMPVMDGYEATQAIRAAEAAGRRTPIVAMTASAMAADRQRCLDAGMDDFLSKPVQLVDVGHKVNLWLRRRTAPGEPVEGAPIPAPDLAAGLPVLDAAVLAELRSLGAEFLTSLAEVFVGAVPGLLADLRAGAQNADTVKFSRSAHALRGSAANMGGARVAALCARLEAAAAAGRLAEIEPDLLLLEAETADLLKALAALMAVTG